MYRSTLRLLSHATLVAFFSSCTYSLCSWREVHLSGSNITFATVFSSQAVRPLRTILASLNLAAFNRSSPAWCPHAAAPGCSLPWMVLSSTQDWPLSWWVERTFLPNTGTCYLYTPKKKFPLQLPGSALGLALTGPEKPRDFLWPPQQPSDVQQIHSFTLSPTDTVGKLKSVTIKCWPGNTSVSWATQVPSPGKTQKWHQEITRFQHREQTHAQPPASQRPQPPHLGLQLQIVLPLTTAWKNPTAG